MTQQLINHMNQGITMNQLSCNNNNDDDIARNFASSIIMGPIIGRGAFATVHVAKTFVPDLNSSPEQHSQQEMYLAVKCINKGLYEGAKGQSSLKTELEILARCASTPFVAKIFFAFETESTQYLGLEYCSGGDLHSMFTKQGIARDDAISYIMEIAIGLGQLHELCVVYHDLKPENICIDQYDHVKLVDFGLAAILDESMYNPVKQRCEIISGAGTLDYSAPEIFAREPHAYEVDWWSFGVLAYELLCGELPFFIAGTQVARSEYICSPASFHRNDVVAPGSVEESFVSMFLQKNPTKRFGYNNTDITLLLNHPLFEEINDSEF